MYATVGKDGKFTGTVYDSINDAIQAWHDENGFSYISVTTPPVNAGTDENPDYGSPTADQLTAQADDEWKRSRSEAVSNIKVTTTAGNTFDGDEISQSRMARTITAMSDTDSIIWVLSDNTTIQATKAELTEALKLSGEAQTSLWIKK